MTSAWKLTKRENVLFSFKLKCLPLTPIAHYLLSHSAERGKKKYAYFLHLAELLILLNVK
jgi:hypothetical protein